MSIFDNISKRVSETAKAAAKMSGDIVEVTKLNMSIGAEEDKIKKVFADIGKTVYDAHASGKEVAENLKELCMKVESYEKNIEEMKKKILELKKVKMCPRCDTELEIDMVYCFKCGEKQEMPKAAEKETEDEASEENCDCCKDE